MIGILLLFFIPIVRSQLEYSRVTSGLCTNNDGRRTIESIELCAAAATELEKTYVVADKTPAATSYYLYPHGCVYNRFSTWSGTLYFKSASSTKTCSDGSCLCVSGTECQHTGGSQINVGGCFCGTNTCFGDNLYCDLNVCRDVPKCDDGENSEDCACGDDICNEVNGRFCSQNTQACTKYPQCNIIDSSSANDGDCSCGSSDCTAATGLFCSLTENACRQKPCDVTDGSSANDGACECNTVSTTFKNIVSPYAVETKTVDNTCTVETGLYCFAAENRCEHDGYGYSVVTSGKCTDQTGRTNVYNAESCRAAVSLTYLSENYAGYRNALLSSNIWHRNRPYSNPSGCSTYSHYQNLILNTNPSSTESCSVEAKCICLVAQQCEDTTGLVQNAKPCICGNKGCTSESGLYCDTSAGMCSKSPKCLVTDGKIANSAACNCAGSMCTNETGLYCDISNPTQKCAATQMCSNDQGFTPNDSGCRCGHEQNICTSGSYCNAEISECATTPSCRNSNGQELNAEDCYCVTDLCTSSTGRWCNKAAPAGNRCISFGGTWEPSKNEYTCLNTFGTASNRAGCVCGTTQCTVTSGLFCNAAISQCSSDGTFTVGGQTQAACQYTDGQQENPSDCVCGSTLCQSGNMYCDAANNVCNPSPSCAITDGSDTNTRSCMCSSDSCQETEVVQKNSGTCASNEGIHCYEECKIIARVLGLEMGIEYYFPEPKDSGTCADDGSLTFTEAECPNQGSSGSCGGCTQGCVSNSYGISWMRGGDETNPCGSGGYMCLCNRKIVQNQPSNYLPAGCRISGGKVWFNSNSASGTSCSSTNTCLCRKQGLVCTEGTCSRPPTCTHRDGVTANDGPCACGLADCSLNTGFACDFQNNQCVLEDCSDIDGKQANARPCKCGSTACNEDTGLHCLKSESMCAPRYEFHVFTAVTSGASCLANNMEELTQDKCSMAIDVVFSDRSDIDTNINVLYPPNDYSIDHGPEYCYVKLTSLGSYFRPQGSYGTYDTQRDCSDTDQCICTKFLGTVCLNSDGLSEEPFKCQCGPAVCDSGEYCAGDVCYTAPKCASVNGLVANEDTCTCNGQQCDKNYCNEAETESCVDLPACQQTDGLVTNENDCQCSSSPCDATSGLFCYDSECSGGQKCGTVRCEYGQGCVDGACKTLPVCAHSNGEDENEECRCGSNVCGTNEYCVAERNQCTPNVPCLNITGVATNPEACQCGSPMCDANDYCTQSDNLCSPYPKCTNTKTQLSTSCSGWRQTGDCDPDGPRESQWDASCTSQIGSGSSGYCECGDGRRVKYGCGHNIFRCADECAKEVFQLHKMSSPCECGTDTCAVDEFCRPEFNRCSQYEYTFVVQTAGTCSTKLTDDSTCRRAWHELTGQIEIPYNVQCLNSGTCSEDYPCICWLGTTDPFFDTCMPGINDKACTCESSSFNCKRTSSKTVEEYPVQTATCTSDDDCRSITGKCDFEVPSGWCQYKGNTGMDWAAAHWLNCNSKRHELEQIACTSDSQCNVQWDSMYPAKSRIHGIKCEFAQDVCHEYPYGDTCNPGQQCAHPTIQKTCQRTDEDHEKWGAEKNDKLGNTCASDSNCQPSCKFTNCRCVRGHMSSGQTWFQERKDENLAIGDEYFYTRDYGEFLTCASHPSNSLITQDQHCGTITQPSNMIRTSDGLWVEKSFDTESWQHGSDWSKIGSGANGWNEINTEAGGMGINSFYRYVWDCERPDDYCAAPSTYDCRNIITTQCSTKDGTVLNDVATCKCGGTTCDIVTGMYCVDIGDTSKCTWTPPCENRDGTVRNTQQCTCGTDTCVSEFCLADKNECTPNPVCERTSAFLANTGTCRCGETTCDAASGLYCSSNDNACFKTPQCQNQDGTMRNGGDCTCGLTECTAETGRYCLSDVSTCSEYAACDNTVGAVTNSGECACGKIDCIEPSSYCWANRSKCSLYADCPATGQQLESCTCNTADCVTDDYCWFDRDHCSEYPDCQNTNGENTNNVNCTCNTDECTTGDYCWFDRNHCSEFPECNPSGSEANPEACTCGVAACKPGQYCNDGTCQDVPVCLSGLNAQECTCQNTNCTFETGLECSDGVCQAGACVDTNGVQSNDARCLCKIERDEYIGYPVSSEVGETGRCPSDDYIPNKETCALATNNLVAINEIDDATKPRGCFEKSGIVYFNIEASTIECQNRFEEDPETCHCFVPQTTCEPDAFCSDKQCNEYGDCPNKKGLKKNENTCICAGQECSGYCLEVLGQCRATANNFTKDGLSVPVCQSTNETCLCGDETNVCRPTSPGLSCDSDTSVCSRPTECENTIGWTENSQGCRCGNIDCSVESGYWCRDTGLINQCTPDGRFATDQTFYIGDGACKSTAWLEEPFRPFTIGITHPYKKCNTLEAPCPMSGECTTSDAAMMTPDMNDDWNGGPPLIHELVGYDEYILYKNTMESLHKFGYYSGASNIGYFEEPDDLCDTQSPYYNENDCYNMESGLGLKPSCNSEDKCGDITGEMKTFLDEKMKEQCMYRCKKKFPARDFFTLVSVNRYYYTNPSEWADYGPGYLYETSQFKERRCLCVGSDNQCLAGGDGGSSYSIDYEEFPPLLDSGDALYNPDRVEECRGRCNEQAPATAWFMRKGDERCACVGEDNDCSEGEDPIFYERYQTGVEMPVCVNGTNNELCICGSDNNICQPTDPGLVCDYDSSTCSRPANCTDRTGTIESSQSCACGSSDCSSLSGMFCHLEIDQCLKVGRCQITNGTIESTLDCRCGQTFCQEADEVHCLAGLSQCRGTPNFDLKSLENVERTDTNLDEIGKQCVFNMESMESCASAARRLSMSWDAAQPFHAGVLARAERKFEINDPNYPPGCSLQSIVCTVDTTFEDGFDGCGIYRVPKSPQHMDTLYFNINGLGLYENNIVQNKLAWGGHSKNPYSPSGCKGEMDCGAISSTYFTRYSDRMNGYRWSNGICYTPTTYPACPQQDGIFLNEMDKCLCNENLCKWSTNKMACLEGSCQRPPVCANEDGTVLNNETHVCSCGSTHCMNKTMFETSLSVPKLWHGNYCRITAMGPYDLTDRCDPYPACEELHGVEPTTYKCMCAKTACEPGEYCANGQCIAYGGDVIAGTWSGNSLQASGFVGPLCIHTIGDVECICGSEYNVCQAAAIENPYTWDNVKIGNGIQCTFATSTCSRPPACENTTGISSNNELTCSCGAVDCWSNTGMYCYEEENVCRNASVCANNDGTAVNSECVCRLETCGANKYCSVSRAENFNGSTAIGCYNLDTAGAAYLSYLGEKFTLETCAQEAAGYGYKYFGLGNSGGFGSDDHCQPTLTEEECRSAAENEGYVFKGALSDSNKRPRGCYKRKAHCAYQGYYGWRREEDSGVYYNPNGQSPDCLQAETTFTFKGNSGVCEFTQYGVDKQHASGCFCGADCFGWNDFTKVRANGAATCSALGDNNEHQVYLLTDSHYYYTDLYCYTDETLLSTAIGVGFERDDCWKQASLLGFKYFGLIQTANRIQCRGGNELNPILKSGRVGCSATSMHVYSSRNCQDCTTEMCRDYPKCELDEELTATCLCGDDTCTTGQYCNNGICQPKPKCEHTDGITANSAVCMCGINECSSGEYCHGDIFDVCSSAPKCEHQLGSIANSENCWCKVTSPANASYIKHLEDFIYCDNQPYCQSGQAGHERCDVRADTYPTTSDGQTFEYIIRCPGSFIKNTEKCQCYDQTACSFGDYCIDEQYCSANMKCRFNDGIELHEESNLCSCNKDNTCKTSFEACYETGICSNPKCAAGGSSLFQAGCKCFDGDQLLDTCSTTQYCYNPPGSADGGCKNEPINRCFNREGDTPNDDYDICLCGSNANRRKFCTKGQYCNDDKHMCSDIPNPTCENTNGLFTNGDTTCLCMDEDDTYDICQPFQFCNVGADKKCHKQYCRDYVYGEKQLCNVQDTVSQSREVDNQEQIFETVVTYGNGLVSNGTECTTTDVNGICQPESFKECCRECPSENTHILGTGLCQSDCDYGICTGEWIPPPTEGTRISFSTRFWNKYEIQSRLNSDWTNYCYGESCDVNDQKTCCVKPETCPIGKELLLCQELKHTRAYKDDATCSDFECTAEDCCEVRECTCTGGTPKPAYDCPQDGKEECDYCDPKYWKTANQTCSPIIECLATQFETLPPTPRIRNRACQDLTVCVGDEFISTNETIRTGDPTSDVYDLDVAISDRTCQNRTRCLQTEYQPSVPNEYQDRRCIPLTACGTEEYADREWDGQQWTEDSDCKPKTICAPSEYIVSNGTKTTDRNCSAIDPPCPQGKLETQAPIPGIRNRFCQEPRECTADEYETQAPNATQNRECAPLTECSETQYESQAQTATADRVCSALSECSTTQYQTVAPSATSDRQCANVTVCDPNINEYEETPPTATADRQCATCTDCVGCLQETDCTFDPGAKISYLDVSPVGANTCSGHTCVNYDVGGTNQHVVFHPTKGALEYGRYYRFNLKTQATLTISGVQLFKGRVPSGTEASIQKDEYIYFQIPMNHPESTAITYKPGQGTATAFALERDCQQTEHYVGSKDGSPVCTSVCGDDGSVLLKRTTEYGQLGDGAACLPTWTSTPCVCSSECPSDYAIDIDTFLTGGDYNGACFNEDCKCPVDCVYTVNDDFEPCDAPCGEQGFKIKKIVVTTPAAHKGKACPAYGAKETCKGDYEIIRTSTYENQNKCDCDGNTMDRCGICGGKNRCVGCDGIPVLPNGNAILPDGREVSGYRKQVRDRCGICGGDGSTCAAKFKLKAENKKTTSHALQTGLPIIIAVVVIAIFVAVFYCIFKKPEKDYVAIATEDKDEENGYITNIRF